MRSPVDPNQLWEGKIQTNYDLDVDTALKETKLNLYLTQTETQTGVNPWTADTIEDLMCVEDWTGASKDRYDCFNTMYKIVSEDLYEMSVTGFSGFPRYPTI